MELIEAKIERIVGNPKSQFAVVLSAEEKRFLIFVGQMEAIAVFRALGDQPTDRPMTHDLMSSLFVAFDINVRRIAISSLSDGIFCATLQLTQSGGDESEPRSEVRLDLRASDAIVLALKTESLLYVAREVLEDVDDVTEQLPDVDGFPDDEDEGL